MEHDVRLTEVEVAVAVAAEVAVGDELVGSVVPGLDAGEHGAFPVGLLGGDERVDRELGLVLCEPAASLIGLVGGQVGRWGFAAGACRCLFGDFGDSLLEIVVATLDGLHELLLSFGGVLDVLGDVLKVLFGRVASGLHGDDGIGEALEFVLEGVESQCDLGIGSGGVCWRGLGGIARLRHAGDGWAGRRSVYRVFATMSRGALGIAGSRLNLVY